MSLVTTNSPRQLAAMDWQKAALAPHIAAVMQLAIAARPTANPPTDTYRAFQLLCGHIEPELLTLGMAECLQHFKYAFPAPSDVLSACDFIRQLIDRRGLARKTKSYQAQGKADAQAFDLAEFERRLLPPTRNYIDRKRAETALQDHSVDATHHNEEMLANAEANLVRARTDEQREYFAQAVASYRARLGQ